ncbi:MAG TPA: S8 family serine peptidase [Burkholderiaceae bacterium]|nr:S8 family serine peptidase [Burkholderiaceae bacterium]
MNTLLRALTAGALTLACQLAAAHRGNGPAGSDGLAASRDGAAAMAVSRERAGAMAATREGAATMAASRDGAGAMAASREGAANIAASREGSAHIAVARDATAASPASPDVPVLSGDAAAPQRQLLVMLRLPPPHFRPDAGYGGRYLDDGGRSARHRIAEQLARLHGLKLVGDWPMPTLGVDCYVMESPSGSEPARIADLLSHDPRVEWAQPVAIYSGMDGAAPPLYPVQPSARYWHVAELHRAATGRNVSVAVVDSGIDARHPDLDGQLALAENFVDGSAYAPESHGTAVAGIIAARGGRQGILGVAPGARLMGLRACWQLAGQGARCSSFTLGKALNFAILHEARIINLSLSGPPDRLLDRLLDVALARGISVVGAIDPQGRAPAFPASHRGVVAVAQQGGAAPGLQRPQEAMPSAPGLHGPQEAMPSAPCLHGPQAAMPAAPLPQGGAVLAPGQDVPASLAGGGWRFVSGNSYAAAHVTGMLALLAELRPGADGAQLERLLVPGTGPNAATIDACATIAHTTGACSCSCAGAVTLHSSRRP